MERRLPLVQLHVYAASACHPARAGFCCCGNRGARALPHRGSSRGFGPAVVDLGGAPAVPKLPEGVRTSQGPEFSPGATCGDSRDPGRTRGHGQMFRGCCRAHRRCYGHVFRSRRTGGSAGRPERTDAPRRTPFRIPDLHARRLGRPGAGRETRRFQCLATVSRCGRASRSSGCHRRTGTGDPAGARDPVAGKRGGALMLAAPRSDAPLPEECAGKVAGCRGCGPRAAEGRRSTDLRCGMSSGVSGSASDEVRRIAAARTRSGCESDGPRCCFEQRNSAATPTTTSSWRRLSTQCCDPARADHECLREYLPMLQLLLHRGVLRGRLLRGLLLNRGVLFRLLLLTKLVRLV